MKWNTIADVPLSHEEELQRIRAAQQMLEAISRGDQIITPQTMVALRLLAKWGLQWMIFWHEQIHHGDESIDEAQSMADDIERHIINSMQKGKDYVH